VDCVTGSWGFAASSRKKKEFWGGDSAGVFFSVLGTVAVRDLHIVFSALFLLMFVMI
jgi:hypothetical protein